MKRFNNLYNRILESLDSIKPIGKIKHTKPVYKSGTIFATPSHVYEFTTTNNNKVSVQIVMYDPPSITFFVNDMTAEQPRELDKEILSNVIYVLMYAIKNLKLSKFKFEATTNHKDVKIIRGLDGTEVYDKLMNIFDHIIPIISKHVPEVKKTIAGRDIYDLNKTDIRDLEQLYTQLKDKNAPNVPYYFYDQYMKPLIALDIISKSEAADITKWLEEWNEVSRSNSDLGLVKPNNRRLNIYIKILNKYFKDWTYEVHGNTVFVSKK